LDYGAAAPLEGSPYQAIDEGIFQNCEGWLPACGKGDQPIRIVASRMRHREENRQVPTRLVDDWGGELAHDQG
jgi:hypothetical protein